MIKKSNKALDGEQKARRMLLKMGAYAPPTILGVMMAGTKVAEAANPILGAPKTCKGGGMIIVSANGNACCPCVPTDPKFDPVKCAWKKCQLGNCSACPPAPYRSSKQCAKVAKSCACACKPGRKKKQWVCN